MVLIGSEKEPSSPPARRRLRRLWFAPVAAAVVAVAVVSAVLTTSGSSGPERPSRTASAQQASTPHGSTHGGGTTTTPPPPPPPPPADAHPLASPPLPGEGHWVPAGRVAVRAPEGRPHGPFPAVYTTTLRPGNGSAPTGLAWVHSQLTKTDLYQAKGEA